MFVPSEHMEAFCDIGFGSLRGSSVNIATRLWTGRQGFDSSQVQELFFSLCHRFQTGSKAHSDSYPMGIGDIFLDVKAAGAWC
jgi:hypothetical protein